MKPSAALAASIGTVCLVFAGAVCAADGQPGEDMVLAINGFLGEKASELLSKKTDNIQLKYIEPEAAGDKAGWGIDYAWKISKENAPAAEPKDGEKFIINRLSYELAVDGSYVFDDAKNNQDLSTVTAALKLSHGDFGKVSFVRKEISDAYQDCLSGLHVPASEADIPAYDRAAAQCAQVNGINRKITSRDQRAYYYWLDFHGGVEANQNYTDTHTLFGLAGALSYRPDSRLAWVNLPDLPFSLLRRAFTDPQQRGYVAPFPSLLLGIDRLDADSKDPRSVLTDDGTFTRLKGEVAFSTQVANFGGQILRLTSSYRYYKELSAPAAVKAAKLDEFKFFTASLRIPANALPLVESKACELFVSYTRGKLPFGVASDQTFEIGIATNIQALADFLAH